MFPWLLFPQFPIQHGRPIMGRKSAIYDFLLNVPLRVFSEERDKTENLSGARSPTFKGPPIFFCCVGVNLANFGMAASFAALIQLLDSSSVLTVMPPFKGRV